MNYIFANNPWGDSCYKIYRTKLNYGDAKARCEADGTFLAIPRSETENMFIAGLFTDENSWIGINDIEQEGNFVSVDGRGISFTNWNSGEPNDWSFNEDGVEINFNDGRWNDLSVNEERKFVCSINLQGKIFRSN